jgi:hypothetical protein
MLLSASLSILKEFLDDCLQDNDKPNTSMDLQLTLNYQSFINIVPRITESGFHSHLPAHLVIETFLSLKWEKDSNIFFLDIYFYIIFLFCLIKYILYSEPYYTVNEGGAASNITGHLIFNDSNITFGMNESKVITQQNKCDQFLLWLFLMGLLLLRTVKYAVQLCVHRNNRQFLMEEVLQMFLIVCTFVSCSGMVDDKNVKEHRVFGTALMLGWFEFFLMAGRHPLLSVQVEMFKRVSPYLPIFNALTSVRHTSVTMFMIEAVSLCYLLAAT